MRPGRLKRVCTAALFAGVVLAGTFGLFDITGLGVNPTASLPVGLYVRTSDPNGLVEFCPDEPYGGLAKERGYRGPGVCPDGAAPLMKPVVAAAGDVVTVTERGIAVNGRLLLNSQSLPRDSKGRGLSAWPAGIYPVGEGSLWTVSSYSSRSFDSRYFGPIASASVRERLKPLLVWRGSSTPVNGGCCMVQHGSTQR